MTEAEFKEKARREVFNASLKSFPVIFEMYARVFCSDNLDIEASMGDIIQTIRMSNREEAYENVCHYLDLIE